MDTDFLNHILVQMDIAQTGCGWFDGTEIVGEFEYLNEAETIVQLLASGSPAQQAVSQAFAARFDAANLPPEQRQAHIAQLSRELQTQQRLQVLRTMKPRLPGPLLDVSTLSLLLWQTDPMGTGCNVQEGLSGEYYSAAEATIALRATGLALEPALRQVFDEQFWPGCLQADHRQAHLQTLLQTVAELERLAGQTHPATNPAPSGPPAQLPL